MRGYGQRDPLVEYKKESFALFQAMKDRVDEEIVRYLWWLRPMVSEEALPRRRAQRSLILSGGGSGQPQPAFAGVLQSGSEGAAAPAHPGGPRPARSGGDDAVVKTVRRDEPKVGRNDPCPCGSGKKYKKCHGR